MVGVLGSSPSVDTKEKVTESSHFFFLGIYFFLLLGGIADSKRGRVGVLQNDGDDAGGSVEYSAINT